MSSALQLRPVTSNINPRIVEKLTGYWERDEWFADDPEMLAFGKVSGRNAAFNFSPLYLILCETKQSISSCINF